MSSFNDLKKIQTAFTKTYNFPALDELAKISVQLTKNLDLSALNNIEKVSAKLAENLDLSILEEFAKTSAKLVENLNLSTFDNLQNIDISIEHLPKIPTPLLELCQNIAPEHFKLLKYSNTKSECIDSPKDNCNSVNTVLESSNPNDTISTVSERKITLKQVIYQLIIILQILLPMLQNSYYHKLDAIETQETHIEELQLNENKFQQKEEELNLLNQQLQNDMEQKELLEKILIQFQTFLENYESLQTTPEEQHEIQDSADEVQDSVDEVQDSADEVQEPVDSIQDNDLSNFDVP